MKNVLFKPASMYGNETYRCLGHKIRKEWKYANEVSDVYILGITLRDK
jgi:hypothetical protein